MGETVEKTDCGISMKEVRITNSDFTDDVIVFVETLEVLAYALVTLSMESEILG